MGSLSFGEILVILVVILLVFGPRRLPEISRKASELVTKARQATTYVSSAIDSGYGESMQPIKELKQEIDGLRGDMSSAMNSFTEVKKPAPTEPVTEVEKPDPAEPTEQ